MDQFSKRIERCEQMILFFKKRITKCRENPEELSSEEGNLVPLKTLEKRYIKALRHWQRKRLELVKQRCKGVD